MENYTMEKAIKKAVKIPPIAYPYNGTDFLTIKKISPIAIRMQQRKLLMCIIQRTFSHSGIRLYYL